MIKQVPVSELKVGMYVHQLNSQWVEHPLNCNDFLIESEEDIGKIAAAGVRDVCIDSDRGLDADGAPTLQEAVQSLEAELSELAAGQCMLPIQTTLEEELAHARKIKSQAQQTIREVMHDARLGNLIRLDDVEPVVEDIVDSILRNPGALAALSQIKNKDAYTFSHSVSVGTLLTAFCVSTGMDKETIHQAGLGGLLHDAGKACVPDEVLNKPGKLTPEEFAIMQNHPAYGFELLSAIPGIGPIPIDIAHHHHERFNGDGYPDRIEGSKIRTVTQMASIADVYDSFTSTRSYHRGMCPAAALRMMFQWSRSHFDQKLMQDFMRCVGFYPVGTLVQLESGLLGVVVEQHECSLLTPKVRVFYDTRNNWSTPARLVDLARPLGEGGGDRILSFESPEKWKIDPQQFLSFAGS